MLLHGVSVLHAEYLCGVRRSDGGSGKSGFGGKSALLQLMPGNEKNMLHILRMEQSFYGIKCAFETVWCYENYVNEHFCLFSQGQDCHRCHNSISHKNISQTHSTSP